MVSRRPHGMDTGVPTGKENGVMEPERNAKHEEIRQDLAQLLADILVEDYQQYPSIMGLTDNSPGGLGRTLEGATST